MARRHVSGGCGHGGGQVSLVNGEDGCSTVSVTQPGVILRYREQYVSVREKSWLAAPSHHSVKVLHKFLCEAGAENPGISHVNYSATTWGCVQLETQHDMV